MNPRFKPTFGWNNRPEIAKAYAATLDPGDEFWDKLEAIDDGRDVFWYRLLVLSLQRAGKAEWLYDRGGIVTHLPYDQKQVGSCVGNGKALEQTYKATIDVFHFGDVERFVGMACAEWCYYTAKKSDNDLNYRDGSTGAGAAKGSCNEGLFCYGELPDVTAYTEARARSWGAGKVPAKAVEIAKPHVCKSYLQVKNARHVWLAAGFGFPFSFCSDQGFEGKRDADGAIKPRGSWNHCMTGGAARRTTAAGRKLVLTNQSWIRTWTDGPYHEDQPEGSFYIDLDVAGSMAAQGDTFVNVDFQGEPDDRQDVSFTDL